MMTFLFFLMFIYMFFSGSFHSLLLLLMIEFMVLLAVFLILSSSCVWVFSVLFLFVSVCMSTYGVSLLVNGLREKGSFYSLSFNMF